jgi:hypothetical protein
MIQRSAVAIAESLIQRRSQQQRIRFCSIANRGEPDSAPLTKAGNPHCENNSQEFRAREVVPQDHQTACGTIFQDNCPGA